MGTKVMVRATRSFNGRVEGDWYWVDPSDPHEGALIRGGYYAHQEDLLVDLPAGAVVTVDPLPAPGREEIDRRLAEKLAQRRGKPRGEVEAEPGEHPQDGAGEGPGAGDPDSAAGPGRGEEGRPE